MNTEHRSGTPIAMIAEIIVMASGCVGIGYRLVSTGGILHSIDHLGYFTVQANIGAVAVVLVSIIGDIRNRPGTDRHNTVAAAVCVYIIVTAIIYQTMLAPGLNPHGFNAVALQLNHLVTPAAYTVWFVSRKRRYEIGFTTTLRFLIYPAAYAIFGTAEGMIRGKYRYFFLDPHFRGLPGYLLMIVCFATLFYLLGIAVIGISRIGRHERG